MNRLVFPFFSVLVAVCFLSLSLPAQNPDYVLTATDATGAPGEQVEVQILLDVSFATIGAWSMSVCSQPAFVSVDDVTEGETTLTVNGGSPPDFLSLETFGNGWITGCVISFFGNNPLGIGTDYELMVGQYGLVTEGTTMIEFCDSLGMPPVQTIVVVGGGSIVPVTEDATVEIMDPVVPFVRGDSNGDGAFVALVDGLFTLNFGFVTGSPAPPCLAAADANGDDGFNALVDALYSLNFGFTPGSPPIPPPYPDCGIDTETVDLLGCDVPPPCP